MKIIDKFLNQTPMYKVVMYSLFIISLVALVESYFGLLPYTLTSLVESLLVAFIICVGVNFAFATSLKLPHQYESSIITALIIFLIILPSENLPGFLPIVVASFFAIASKYILVYRNTHFFNQKR
jgi:Na+-transporting NADH:ubiquinone oxidoreductase subunit NqrB